MSLFRRRLMMVGSGGSSPYDEYGYIKDGKIFHLDGIDKGETTDAWTEIVNGYIYTNYGATELSNGWSFAGNTNSYLRGEQIYPTQSQDFTVEVCIKILGIGNSVIFILNNNNNVNYPLFYWAGGGAITFIQRTNTYNIPQISNSSCCVSFNLDNGCFNGQQKNKSSSVDYWSAQANFSFIGKRNSSDYFKGEIYSIRIYNRRLTFSEQLHNQQVDNQRFNLGLTI